MQLKPLNEQVVVVMGASSGIGRLTALRFAERGATVVCSARSEVGLATLVEEIRGCGGRGLAIAADVADPAQMKNLADWAAAELGRIDTWVHVAAVSVYARFEDTRPAEFARVVEVNLLGQVHGALAALPHLRAAGGGALILISSIEGRISLPFQSAYAASKHGVIGFIDALRLELQREGVPISVTNIMPSSINTPLFRKALTRLGVEPRATPPMYAPELVSRAILHAAVHPTRDLVVGGAGMGLLFANWISAYLTDALLRGRPGFEAQLTDRPKSPEAPNNLCEPTAEGDLTIEGDFSAEQLSRSLPTSLALTRAAAAVRWVARAASEAAGRVMEAQWLLALPRVARRNLLGRGRVAARRGATACDQARSS